MFSWLLGLLVPVAAMARAVVGDSVHTLQDVDVVGVRIAQRMVIGGQRLDGEALRRLDGGSVADALRYFAGVQLKGLWRRGRHQDHQYPIHGIAACRHLL